MLCVLLKEFNFCLAMHYLVLGACVNTRARRGHVLYSLGFFCPVSVASLRLFHVYLYVEEIQRSERLQIAQHTEQNTHAEFQCD